MSRECTSCGRTDKYYAKGLCSICYQRVFREKRLAAKIAAHKGVSALPEEEWRDVIGYEETYMVSNLGRVKSKTREVIYSNERRRVYFEQLLALASDKDGYLVVALCRGGKIKYFRAHRLVAEAFIGLQPKDKPLINHKNGVKNDNRACNLEWVDAFGNMRHRVYTLGKIPSFGIRPIRCVETGAVFPSIEEAARWAHVHSSGLSAILHHKPQHRTAGGLHWEFI